MLTCRFGVRCFSNGRSAACFEVFDRTTGKTVASALSRLEAEADARRRNDDSNGEVEVRGLRAAIDALVTEAAHQCLTFVARAAEALDDAREELARTDRIIAEHQARIGQLHGRFPRPDNHPE